MRNGNEEDDEDDRIFRQARSKPVAAVKPAASKPASQRRDPFVNIPIWWATAAAQAYPMPGFLICVELLHRAWKTRSTTFTLPNGWLEKNGVSPRTKHRVLAALEAAGLISIERRVGKSVRVTLVVV